MKKTENLEEERLDVWGIANIGTDEGNKEQN